MGPSSLKAEAQDSIQGNKILGDGFSVKFPERQLFVQQDKPTEGGVTLRDLTHPANGKVYFVAPFKISAENPEEALSAWNQIPKSKGFTVHVVSKKKIFFRGYEALEAIVDISNPRRKKSMGSIGALLVVQRDTDYLILSRGEIYQSPEMKKQTVKICRKGLAKLKRKVVID